MANTNISREAKVTAFGYRTALPAMFLYSTNTDELLHQLLAKKAGVLVDNHQTFIVENKDGSSVTLLFSGNRIEVGTGIEKRNW